MLNEIRHELRRFAETTGIKGIGRIVKTTSKVIRFFWLISILVCFAILLFQLSKVLSNYTSHTVITSSKVVQANPTFPEVTFCNLFPADNFSSEGYNEYLKSIETMTQYDLEFKITNLSAVWTYMSSIIFYIVNTPLIEEISENDDSFVVLCQQYGWDLYIPTPCRTKAVLTTPLQKCHHIELDWTSGTVAAVTLLLFTDNLQSRIIDSYNPWIRLSSGTGVRVMIHPNGSLPTPKTSITSPAGNQLNILLRQTNVHRLKHPYGNCTDRKLLIPSQSDSPIYTDMACTSLCRQRQMVEKCGCLDNGEIFTDEEFYSVNGTFCYNFTEAVDERPLRREDVIVRHLEFLQCQTNFVPDQHNCSCPIPCSETFYDTTASYSHWPNPLYQLSFYKQYVQNNVNYGSKFAAYEEILKKSVNQTDEETVEQLRPLHLIEDNFLEVVIMFSKDDFQVFTDSAAITWDTLVANLGGSFNLWLGICVPTVAEIIELIYSLFVIVCRNRKSNVMAGASDRKP